MLNYDFKLLRRIMYGKASATDKLCYAMIVGDNDVVMNKDGSLAMSFRFFGDDIQVISELRKAQICLRYSQGAAKHWHDNLMIETNFMRSQAKDNLSNGEFPDAVSELINIERTLQFQEAGKVYESESYFTFTAKEPPEISTGIKNLMYESDDEIVERTLDQMVASFKSNLHQFLSFVSYGRTNQFELLKGDALTTYLNSTITGDMRTIKAPSHKYFLDSYLAYNDFLAGHQPVINGKHVKVIAVDALPNDVYPMLMNELSKMSMEFRYNTRFYLLSKNEAAVYLKRLQRTWSSKAIGIWGILVNAMGGNPKKNEVAEANNFEVQGCIAENESKEVKFGWYNMNFILMDSDKEKLNQSAHDLITTLQNYDLVLREETINTTEAYLGSLPSHGGYNVRVTLMDSNLWSYTLPLSAIYAGEKYNPNPYYPQHSAPLMYALTDQNNIYRFNNCVKDVGHTDIVGPTGSGKTTLLNLFIAQHRKYPSSRQIVLDCNNSSYICILAMGGRYINVDDDGNYSTDDSANSQFSLFDGIESNTQKEIIIDWLIHTFEQSGVNMDVEQRIEVRDAVERITYLKPSMRRFSNLTFDTPELREVFQELRQTIFGNLIDGTEDFLGSNNLLGVEIGKLVNILPPKYLQPLVLLLIYRLTKMFEDRVPTLLILDEAWLFLDAPIFAAKIKEWLKTLRKMNVSVVFATQSLNDKKTSPISPVLVESCPTKIYLPNRDIIGNKKILEQYISFGLTEEECYQVANATPKQHYMIKQPNSSRVIDFNVGELALQFISLDKEEDRKLFLKHYKANDQRYLVDYLNEKGLPDAANLIANILNEKTDNSKVLGALESEVCDVKNH
ncbi:MULTISPECIES: hypothetical protein [Cysteiniphilum]|uniref:Conjugal transfer protein TrbE n=1 Tax=Cysteiniphilum litorale TaxID=2056700 RepID=A0A8J2Z3T0_9GAMM|nr:MULTISPECIES: hypothetical protein [Cysteiniphilum]GGF93760.1 conjugal transfer protein TrbE [Cysteiniphilum litorale]